ncbi:hypothetical protein GCM10023323_68720 [Streptomyces thinghirensis]|uniref:Uncharacterized protein n=1 Tax=Streptomyces thinghirensis TaxID=551547 RepID=A0ABP9TFE7_9ACTN
MQQMGRVDLPVAVPHRSTAGAGDHGCQFFAEPGIEIGAVRAPAVLLAGRLPGDTGLHIP